MLENVPERQYILIHPANNAARELKGCIAPVSIITGRGEGIYSVKALQKIMNLLSPAFDNNQPVYITIKKN